MPPFLSVGGSDLISTIHHKTSKATLQIGKATNLKEKLENWKNNLRRKYVVQLITDSGFTFSYFAIEAGRNKVNNKLRFDLLKTSDAGIGFPEDSKIIDSFVKLDIGSVKTPLLIKTDNTIQKYTIQV